MKAYSLRRRLVLVVVAAMALVLTAVALVLYVAVKDAAWKQHDNGLAARARALAAIAEHDDEGYEMELPPQPSSAPATYVEVWKPDGSVLARTPGLVEPPLGGSPGYVNLDRRSLNDGRSAVLRGIAVYPFHGNPVFEDVTLPDGRAGRAVVLWFMPRDENGDAKQLAIVLGEGVEDVASTIQTVRTWFLVVGLGALIAITLLVWRLVGSALEPLDRTAALIEKIDDKSLTRRLPVEGQPVELVTPVNKLNELLARLETSFARERQFTADVSHELRTPIAGLRTVLEVTALSDRDTAEYKKALADAHSIVLQLGALVDNLLTLARLDAGQLPTTLSSVDLHDLVDECWKSHAAAAAARSLTFRNKLPPSVASVDPGKLRVILGNLLANAAEYTEAGGWIEVNADGALLAVVDSGPPLPDERKIFDRLWRGDSSRTRTGVHCGIGLALAKSLAEHMALALTAANQSDGSVRFAISRQ